MPGGRWKSVHLGKFAKSEKKRYMENILESFASCMSVENGIDLDFCRSLTKWMESEGALDYDTLREVYAEPAVSTNVAPTLHLVG